MEGAGVRYTERWEHDVGGGGGEYTCRNVLGRGLIDKHEN